MIMVQSNFDRHISLSVEQYQKVVVSTEPDWPISITCALITLAEAAEWFDLKEATLRHWVFRGLLVEKDRVPTPRARKRILVDAQDVAYLQQHPPKMGRPGKH